MPDLRPAMYIKDMYRAYSRESYLILYHCYRLLAEVAGEPEKIKLSGGFFIPGYGRRCGADIFGKRWR